MSIQSLKVDLAALQRLPENPLGPSYAERGLAGGAPDLSCTGNANGGGQLVGVNTNSCLLTCTAAGIGAGILLGGGSGNASASCDNTL